MRPCSRRATSASRVVRRACRTRRGARVLCRRRALALCSSPRLRVGFSRLPRLARSLALALPDFIVVRTRFERVEQQSLPGASRSHRLHAMPQMLSSESLCNSLARTPVSETFGASAALLQHFERPCRSVRPRDWRRKVPCGSATPARVALTASDLPQTLGRRPSAAVASLSL